MSNPKNPRARVDRGAVNRQKLGDRVTALDGVCDAGAQTPQITSSAVGAAALADLKAANTKMKATLVSHTALAIAYRASCKQVHTDSAALDLAASTYMTTVNNIAAGDAALIAKAGFQSSLGGAPVSSPEVPGNVYGKPGKEKTQVIVGWDAAPGAGAYKLRVNFTPADPSKWEELSSGTSRRRTVTVPAPGAQFLVSVASIGNDDVSAWSDPILVTAA